MGARGHSRHAQGGCDLQTAIHTMDMKKVTCTTTTTTKASKHKRTPTIAKRAQHPTNCQSPAAGPALAPPWSL